MWIELEKLAQELRQLKTCSLKGFENPVVQAECHHVWYTQSSTIMYVRLRSYLYTL